jgi:hypothetical protein
VTSLENSSVGPRLSISLRKLSLEQERMVHLASGQYSGKVILTSRDWRKDLLGWFYALLYCTEKDWQALLNEA